MTNDLTTSDHELTIPEDLWRELGSNTYSPEQMLNAIYYTFMYGSHKAQEMTGVNNNTIRGWKLEPWYERVENEIIKLYDRKSIANLTQIVHSSTEQLRDRIENGEYVYKDDQLLLDDDGNPVRKKLTSHRLAVDGLAIPNQHRMQLRLDPNKTPESSNTSLLEKFANEFIEISKQARQKNITNTIEGQQK